MSAYNYLLDINNLRVNQPSASFFTKDQARSIALLAITIISSTFETKLFGARNPPTQSDALVKLFSRRLRVDEVTLRLAKMIIDGRATKEERNWFRSLVVCFDGMVARDVKRARRHIAKEPILTTKGKNILKSMVWYSNFWERYMDLPKRSTSKRRNNKVADLLIRAMEKAEKKERETQEAGKKMKELQKLADAVSEVIVEGGLFQDAAKAAKAESKLTKEETARWKAAGALDDVYKPEVSIVKAQKEDSGDASQKLIAEGETTQEEIAKAGHNHEALLVLIVEAKHLGGDERPRRKSAETAESYMSPCAFVDDTEERNEAVAEKKIQLVGDEDIDAGHTNEIGRVAQSIVDDVYTWI